MATPQPLRLSLLITGNGDQLSATLHRVDIDLHRTGAAGQAAGERISAGMRTADIGLHGMSNGIRTATGLLLGLAGIGTIAELGKEVFETNAEFQSFRTSLQTTTSTAENANLAFGFIQDFAAKTPFSVGQVTESFIKLANLGLKPSEEALRSYGNTASAQGKPIMQMIEAVADAATGEFERLKEFGIKASKEGDKVAFTFAGTTTTVGNSAAEIERYLINLGNSKFGDSMAAQANTIKGAVSNLGDTWESFMDNLWDANTENAIASWVKTAGEALHSLDVLINGAIRNADKLAAIDDSIIRKRASLAAHQDNGWLGSMIDDLTGYDPNLVLNQIDAQVKARQKLIKTMGDQKKAQSDMIDGLGKTGKDTGTSDKPANDAALKIMQDLIDKNHQLTLSERENFKVKAEATGASKEWVDSALAVFDANARVEQSHKAAADAVKKHHEAASENAKSAESIAKQLQSEIAQLETRNRLLKLGEREAFRQDFTSLAGNVTPRISIDFAPGAPNEHLQYFEKLGEKYSYLANTQEVLRLSAEEYSKTFSDLIVVTESSASAQEKRAMALWDENKALEDAQKKNEAQKSELESLTDQYKKLTLSARDYYLETLKKKGIKGDALQTDIAQFDTNTRLEKNNKELDDARQRIEGYGRSVRDLSSDFNGLGNTSSSVFDAQLGGLSAMAGAFGNLFITLDKTQVKMAELAKQREDINNFKMASPVINPEQYVKDLALRDQKLKDLAREEAYYTKQNTAATLAGTRQMAGAFSDMFAENSAGRKGFHALEMTLGAAEVAYNLYANAQTIASNSVAIASNIKAGASKIWAQMGIFAPIGLAAMAASLVAYGVGAVGGSSIAEPPKSSPDTGTVLGDSTAQSKSVDNLFKLLQDIHASEYAELRGINSGVNDLQTALSGTITRLFQAGGLDTSNKGIDLSYGIGDSITRSFTTGAGLAATILSTGIGTALSFGVTAGITALSGAAVTGATTAAAGALAGLGIGSMAGPIGTVAGLLFSGINALFSGGYRDVTERGIQTKAQTLGDVVGGSSLNAMQYNVIKTREWDLFSDSTRFDTVFNKLDNKVVDSLTNVFESAGSVSLMLANALGGDLSDKVKNYVLPELKIDLTKLNAEDASKKLNAVISTTLDTMANDLFAGVVGEYQQIGEGMLETAARIVSEVSVVKSALNTSGLSISGDTIKISDSLVQLAGGIKSFQKGFSGYYDKFYTDAEKQAQLQATLTSSLGELFMALPATRQGYRDVLEALNLNNEADQKRYTLLIQLSDAADSYYKSLESGLKTLEDGVKSAFDTAAGLLQKQVDTYRGFANQFKSFSDSLLMTAANPQQKYDLAKTAFVDIKAVLDSSTSTTEQKDAALAQLQAVTQTYLDASRAYNGSSLDYFKDFAEAQALLSKEITANNNKADLAQSQLDKITEQVTALGLLNTSVLTVDGSVRALTIAMVGLVKAKESELQIAADNANRAVFNKNEAARKSAYETPIANKATAIGGIAQKQEDRIGWSGNSSKWAFGASGAVDPSTGNSTSQVSSYAHSGDVNNVIRHQLDNAKGQFSAIGKMIQNIIGGDLPEVFISLKSDGRDRDAFESYTFNGQTRTLKSYDIDPLVRLFAKDSVDYLANALSDKTWADQLKKISFSSIGGGMSDLSSLMDHLRNPFKDATYDPNKVYVDGSHRAGLDYVPRDGYIAELHQGERVLTAEQAKQSRVIVGPDNQEGIDRLIRANKELSNQHRADADKHTQAVIDTLVEGIKANVTGQAALERQLKDVKTELERTRRELAQARVAG